MFADHRGHYLRGVRDALSVVIYPLQYAVNLPTRASRWISENLHSRVELSTRLEAVRQRQLLAEARLEKFEQLKAENERLRALLHSSIKVADRVLVAELMAVDMDPYSRRIVLNKGRHHGVVSGQSLIDARGVMGQVVHAGPISSTALLITDPNHAMPVQINRSGYRTVAVGSGVVNQLMLSHVPNNADIQVGDLVTTSGLGQRFPAGYPVGRVRGIERDSSRPFARIVVTPSARLGRNREVLLLIPVESEPASKTPAAVEGAS